MVAPSYADDIMLISPSIGCLNKILKLCDSYTIEYIMLLVKKSVCNINNILRYTGL